MLQRQRVRVICGLALTLAILYFVPNRLLALGVLLAAWFAVFFPVNAQEQAAFVLAALFFLLQNYVCLKAGLFEFRYKDILLMPYYEPPLWGFYFLSMKRFIGDDRATDVAIDKRSVAGLVVTSIAFSLFGSSSHTLLVATLCSTAFLFVLFHSKLDIFYALYALGLGVVIEVFGVWSGLWWYPAPDVGGIPFWFATMWISAGLLGRHFLFPAADWLTRRQRRRAA